jgi:hypothetical protein
MITIEGLTELQRDIADRLWSLDTTEDVEEYISTLPKSLRRQAWTVMTMIIAAELDQVMEITDEVSDYLHSR